MENTDRLLIRGRHLREEVMRLIQNSAKRRQKQPDEPATNPNKDREENDPKRTRH